MMSWVRASSPPAMFVAEGAASPTSDASNLDGGIQCGEVITFVEHAQASDHRVLVESHCASCAAVTSAVKSVLLN